jgi:putative transposase
VYQSLQFREQGLSLLIRGILERMQRNISFAEGEFYHIYNRGVDKRTIFTTPNDYKRFLVLLRFANSSDDMRMSNALRNKSLEEALACERHHPLVALGAYCLMPNHYHLLVSPLEDGGIVQFLRKIQTAYAMYFNLKNNRSGSLFQGPYKALHVDSDQYLQHVSLYIHTNPILKKTREGGYVNAKLNDSMYRQLINYPYSSAKEYMSGEHRILTHTEVFPTLALTHESIQRHITDWTTYEQGQSLLIG